MSKSLPSQNTAASFGCKPRLAYSKSQLCRLYMTLSDEQQGKELPQSFALKYLGGANCCECLILGDPERV